MFLDRRNICNYKIRTHLKEDESNQKKGFIHVHFISQNHVERDEKKKLYELFTSYVVLHKNDDIDEIVQGVRNLLSDLVEEEISIYKELGDYYQFVSYKQGKMDYCSFSIRSIYDTVSVMDSERGIQIQYKKGEQHLESDKDVMDIQNALSLFIEKIRKLRELELKEEKQYIRS